MIEIRAVGWRDLLSRLVSVPGLVDRSARDRADRLAELEAPRVRGRATSAGKLPARVAAAVRTRGPRITVDGAVSVSGRTEPAGDLFFGSEWGGGGRPTTRQFVPYRDDGHWFMPQIRDDAARIAAEWDGAVDDAAREAGF